MKIVTSILLIILLQGCTSPQGMFGGGASYSYEKFVTSDGIQGCKVTSNSSRDIQGAVLKIGKDCEFSTNLEETGGSLKVFEKLIDRIPILPQVPGQ